MFCQNCGTRLEAGSRFCRHCGAQNLLTIADIVAQAPAPTAAAPLTPEHEVFRAQPAFYAVGLSYALAALLSLGATILFGYFGGGLKWVFLFTAFFFFWPVWRHLRRATTNYLLTNHKMEIESGLFAKTQRHIPVQNIQDVTVRASFAQRLLSVGDVIIDSASVAGKIQMTNVRHPRRYADMILAQLPRISAQAQRPIG
jgi:uncharacterized membrane protein YdbT with pleckstrin-like domain